MELVLCYRKVREILIQRHFHRWKICKPLIKAKQTIEKSMKDERRKLSKLKKQREKHENAVQEAFIKESLLNMMIKMLNSDQQQ